MYAVLILTDVRGLFKNHETCRIWYKKSAIRGKNLMNDCE